MRFSKVLATEFLKLRRSKLTWISFLAFGILPLTAGLFTYILKDPEGAKRLGLLGQKASFAVATADWRGYLGFLGVMAAIGGMLMVSVIMAYLFGREYTDNTAKNLLALPIPRAWFAMAKLCVAGTWFAALLAWFCAEGMAVGMFLRLPGWSMEAVLEEARMIAILGVLLLMLGTVTAWIAVAGKGYLAPLGFTMATLVMGTVLSHTGWGVWFPWTIVPLMSGLAGPSVERLPAGSYAVVAVTFAAGIAATLIHLNKADNTQ
jgi:ABC-type transport system involved in multi-copper enzyme maturation permease subunit